MKKLLFFMFTLMVGLTVNAQKVTDIEGTVYKTADEDGRFVIFTIFAGK